MNDELKQIKKQVSLLRIAQGQLRGVRKQGDETWACCPFHNEKTASFAIKVKNGEEVFFCQGCGKGGDVVRFIEYRDHCTTREAIEKIKAMAGVDDLPQPNPEWHEGAQKVSETFHSVADETSKPRRRMLMKQWLPYETALQKSGEALKWLAEVRGISVDTAKALHFGFAPTFTGGLKPEDEPARDKGWILFPRIEGDVVVGVKLRGIGLKAFAQIAGMDPKALFNVETINPLEPVFVTEGEFDTAIMEQAGYRAVSIPNASTKPTPEMKDKLKGAECVYLAGDNDGKVGNAAMKQLGRELGENTYLIEWPGAKDANEFFLKICGGNLVEFRKRVDDLVKTGRNTPITGFTSLLERLRSTGGTDAGKDPFRLRLTPESVDRMNYSPAGSIVVFYSTYSGTGKTVFITQQMLYEAKNGQIVVVFSPELRDEAYLALVAAQILGEERPGGLNRAGFISKEDYEETAQKLDKPTQQGTELRYYVGHSLPETETDKILDFIELTVRRTGATRFVIDTLHRVIDRQPRESQTEAEGRVVKALEKLGIKYGTIFILIGQSNKEAEDLKESRKDSHGVLRGSRELQDVAYGTYLLHRKRIPAATGMDAKDLLVPETDVILMKDRGKGPGAAIVHLVYKPEFSKFYPLQREFISDKLRSPSEKLIPDEDPF